MDIIFLGTGTSNGIPVIGCACGVCRSDDPRNRRFRSSVMVRTGEKALVIDTTPEFRLQALRSGITGLEAVLYTHSHADHLNGLDDIRPLCHRKPLPLYGNRQSLHELRERFSYIFRHTQEGGGKPNVELHEVDETPFEVSAFRIVPVPIFHGRLEILGYRIGSFAYLTDCSRIPRSSYPLLENLEVLVIDALRYRPHETHFSVSQAIEEIRIIAPRRALLTHMTHDLDHETLSKELPPGVQPAYDGLEITISDSGHGETTDRRTVNE